MGVDIDGKLMVGLHGKDVDLNSLDGFGDDPHYAIECAGMTSASPYYGCGDFNSMVIGIDMGDIDLHDSSYTTKINEAKDKFVGVFGKIPKLIGTQDVW